jgi:catechol 2,3-dioxygenase-like lactoylglutathione lyase family enzyme
MRRTLVALAIAALLVGCRGERRSPLAEEAHSRLHDSEMSPPIPIFSVRDLRSSQRYFRDALGFTLKWEDGDPPDFAAVGRGDATVFMCERCQGHPGAWIMIFTKDVDRLHAELVGRKAIIKMPPKDMPWHLREMHVADPDGNVIRFGSELEH